MEVSMPINSTALSVGLVASAIGVGMLLASPADARPSKQRAYAAQRAAPRGTSQSNLVLDALRPAGSDRHGRRSRSIHSFADSARCERLLRRQPMRHDLSAAGPTGA